METVHPTVFYYLRSSKWAAIRNVILKENNGVFDKEYFRKLYKMYKILCAKTPKHCPYPKGYLECGGEYLHICHWEREKDGRLIEYEDSEENAYIWKYSWSITLGTH